LVIAAQIDLGNLCSPETQQFVLGIKHGCICEIFHRWDRSAQTRIAWLGHARAHTLLDLEGNETGLFWRRRESNIDVLRAHQVLKRRWHLLMRGVDRGMHTRHHEKGSVDRLAHLAGRAMHRTLVCAALLRHIGRVVRRGEPNLARLPVVLAARAAEKTDYIAKDSLHEALFSLSAQGLSVGGRPQPDRRLAWA